MSQEDLTVKPLTGRKKLMIPGPVDITEEVRQAMSVPSMPHYGEKWIRLYGETQEMAKQVFGTHNDLYFIAGPGTLALEIALASTLGTNARSACLIPTNGFFGERLITVAEGHGIPVVNPRAPMGEPILPEDLDAALRAHPEVAVVCLVHHETATGVLNPLEELLAVVNEHDKLSIVDAVSSLGGVPLPVDDWGLDICVSVANKALETPPALALMSISERAWHMVAERESPAGWYTDLKTWRWYAENWGDWHPTPVTMPTSNLYALHLSLQLLLEQGIAERHAAYQAAAHATRAGLQALGFKMLVAEPYACPLTTAFCIPEGIDAHAMQSWLAEEQGVKISSGIGELRGQILRVGHLGLARKRDYVLSFLLGVEAYLRSLGRPVTAGESLKFIEGLEV